MLHGAKVKHGQEQCGDDKYTAVYRRAQQVGPVHVLKKEAENKLSKVGSFEVCERISSYFVLFNDGMINHEEYCSESEALSAYDEKVKSGKYGSGVAILLKIS